jgi:hypothetical protein
MYAANTAIAGLYQAYSRELHAFARQSLIPRLSTMFHRP